MRVLESLGVYGGLRVDGVREEDESITVCRTKRVYTQKNPRGRFPARLTRRAFISLA